MNKKLTLFFLTLPLLGLAQEGKFEIKGTVKNNKIEKIYLMYRQAGNNIVDSTHIKNGKFQFQGTIPEPSRAFIANFNGRPSKEQITHRTATMSEFYLDQGNTTFKADGKLETASVSGTSIIEDQKRYLNHLAPIQKALDLLEQNVNNEGSNIQANHSAAKPKRDSLRAEKNKLQIAYINKYPASHFSAEALNDLTIFSFDLPLIQSLFAKLPEKSQQSVTGKIVAQKIKNAKQIAPGQMAPEFQEPDTNGKLVKLSDFRGKYVLVDFWASWCTPCRAENPNVKAAYEKFKNKGFTVLNISLDKDRNRWLKAVEEDKLPWTQISALNGFDTEAVRLYHVEAVPSTFLIDPTGKIVASNLRGEALHKKLAELLP